MARPAQPLEIAHRPVPPSIRGGAIHRAERRDVISLERHAPVLSLNATAGPAFTVVLLPRSPSHRVTTTSDQELLHACRVP